MSRAGRWREAIAFVSSLGAEFLAYTALILCAELIWPSAEGYGLDNTMFLLRLWAIAIVYRAVLLQLYASWWIKKAMVARGVTSLSVAVVDLLAASLWVGGLSTFFPPAELLLASVRYWLPLLLSIFLGSLVFLIAYRRAAPRGPEAAGTGSDLDTYHE